MSRNWNNISDLLSHIDYDDYVHLEWGSEQNFINFILHLDVLMNGIYWYNNIEYTDEITTYEAIRLRILREQDAGEEGALQLRKVSNSDCQFLKIMFKNFTGLTQLIDWNG